MAVGGSELKLPTDLFDTSGKTGTIIDSGTTLAYLPQAAIKLLMAEVCLDFLILGLLFTFLISNKY